jgi:hypothetical protein
MTKGELRKARKSAVATGQPWTAVQEDGRIVQGRVRTRREEARHARGMHRWARTYDSLNGAPESDGDR